MDLLKSKVAIVTGASRGIGRAIARHFAGEGAQVVLCARPSDDLDRAVDEIAATRGAAVAVPLDLREPDAPGRLVDAALTTFGRIDLVINNAGATRRGEFRDLADEDWVDGFALKFFGAVRLTRAAWPQLAAHRGSLLNIVGIGGRTPGALFSIGGSVNAALLSFTKAMADVGIRDGVQANAISPGTIRTGRYEQRLKTLAAEQQMDVAEAEAEYVRRASVTRIGEPADIAHLATFVVSAQGRFLQGALIDMDGGATKTI